MLTNVPLNFFYKFYLEKSPKYYKMCHLNSFEINVLLMINALNFFALLMILHYSLTILNINANALSLIFFINANTLFQMVSI